MTWTHSDSIISQINLRKIKVEVLHCFNETEQYLAMGDELLLTHLDTFGTHNIQDSEFDHLRCSLVDVCLKCLIFDLIKYLTVKSRRFYASGMKQYRILYAILLLRQTNIIKMI